MYSGLRYLAYGIVGFVWGAISYPLMFLVCIPVVGWVVAGPSILAAYTIALLHLPFGREGFGQYWNGPDFLFVSLLTSSLFVALAFVIPKRKAPSRNSSVL